MVLFHPSFFPGLAWMVSLFIASKLGQKQGVSVGYVLHAQDILHLEQVEPLVILEIHRGVGACLLAFGTWVIVYESITYK